MTSLMTTHVTTRERVTVVPHKRRGFASMTPEQRRAIAQQGGRAAHEQGSAHEWTSDEARTAGRKGGSTRHTNRMTKRQQRDERDEPTTRSA